MIKANAAGALKKFKSHNDIGKENYSVRKFKKVIGKMKTNSLKQKGWEKIFDDLSENVFTLEEYSQVKSLIIKAQCRNELFNYYYFQVFGSGAAI